MRMGNAEDDGPYATGFVGQDYGSSAAQSVILMALVIAMTFVQFRFIERKVQY